MVYAIIESGGKQYKVVEGEYIEVDLLPESKGNKIVFEKVLLLVNNSDSLVGSPYIPEVSINATISEHFKGPKIVIFNYRPKERYRVKTGHRQQFSRLLIDSIQFPGKSKEVKTSEALSAPVKKTRSKPTSSVKKTDKKPSKDKPVATKSVKPKASPTAPAKKATKKSGVSKTK
jgi:large subunit ribosomal protein L21